VSLAPAADCPELGNATPNAVYTNLRALAELLAPEQEQLRILITKAPAVLLVAPAKVQEEVRRRRLRVPPEPAHPPLQAQRRSRAIATRARRARALWGRSAAPHPHTRTGAHLPPPARHA
jgi:hypothetical protein